MCSLFFAKSKKETLVRLNVLAKFVPDPCNDRSEIPLTSWSYDGIREWSGGNCRMRLLSQQRVTGALEYLACSLYMTNLCSCEQSG